MEQNEQNWVDRMAKLSWDEQKEEEWDDRKAKVLLDDGDDDDIRDVYWRLYKDDVDALEQLDDGIVDEMEDKIMGFLNTDGNPNNFVDKQERLFDKEYIVVTDKDFTAYDTAFKKATKSNNIQDKEDELKELEKLMTNAAKNFKTIDIRKAKNYAVDTSAKEHYIRADLNNRNKLDIPSKVIMDGSTDADGKGEDDGRNAFAEFLEEQKQQIEQTIKAQKQAEDEKRKAEEEQRMRKEEQEQKNELIKEINPLGDKTEVGEIIKKEPNYEESLKILKREQYINSIFYDFINTLRLKTDEGMNLQKLKIIILDGLMNLITNLRDTDDQSIYHIYNVFSEENDFIHQSIKYIDNLIKNHEKDIKNATSPLKQQVEDLKKQVSENVGKAEVESELAKVKHECAKKLTEEEAEINKYLDSIRGLKQELQSLTKQSDADKAKINQYVQDITQLTEARKKCMDDTISLNQQLSEEAKAYNQLKSMNEMKEKAQTETFNKTLQDQKQSCDDDKDNLEQKIADEKYSLTQAEESLKTLQSELAALRSKMTQSANECQMNVSSIESKLSGDNSSLTSKIKDLENQLASLNITSAECENAKTKLNNEILSLQSRINTLSQEKKIETKRLQDVEGSKNEEMKRLGVLNQENNDLKSKLTTSTQQTEALNGKISDLEINLKKAQDENASVQNLMTSLEKGKVEALSKLQNELNNLTLLEKKCEEDLRITKEALATATQDVTKAQSVCDLVEKDRIELLTKQVEDLQREKTNLENDKVQQGAELENRKREVQNQLAIVQQEKDKLSLEKNEADNKLSEALRQVNKLETDLDQKSISTQGDMAQALDKLNNALKIAETKGTDCDKTISRLTSTLNDSKASEEKIKSELTNEKQAIIDLNAVHDKLRSEMNEKELLLKTGAKKLAELSEEVGMKTLQVGELETQIVELKKKVDRLDAMDQERGRLMDENSRLKNEVESQKNIAVNFENEREAILAKQKDEDIKRAEEARVAQEQAKRAEEAKKAEESRAQEQANRAEEARVAQEQAKRAEEAKKAEESRAQEQAKRAEEAKKAEESRAQEEAKRAEEAKKAEESRAQEEAKRAEEAKKAEEEAKRPKFSGINQNAYEVLKESNLLSFTFLDGQPTDKLETVKNPLELLTQLLQKVKDYLNICKTDLLIKYITLLSYPEYFPKPFTDYDIMFIHTSAIPALIKDKNLFQYVDRDSFIYSSISKKNDSVIFIYQLFKQIITNVDTYINEDSEVTDMIHLLKTVVTDDNSNLKSIETLYQNLKGNPGALNDAYEELQKNKTQVSTFIKYRKDTGTSNPRYDVYMSKDNLLLINYANVDGIKGGLPPRYKREDAVLELQDVSRETYVLGNHKVFTTETAKKIASDDNVKNLLNHVTIKNKDLCIIGYGQSGSGKTSILIYYGQKKEDGILMEMCKLKGFTDVFNKITISLKNIYTYHWMDRDDYNKYEDYEYKVTPIGGDGDFNFVTNSDSAKNNWKLDTDKTTVENAVKELLDTKDSNIFKVAKEYKINPQSLKKAYSTAIKDKAVSAKPEDYVYKHDDEISLAEFINAAFDEREVESTTNNPNSSRSHVLCSLKCFRKDGKDSRRIVICDLAGVENKFAITVDEILKFDLRYQDSDKYKDKDIPFDKYFCEQTAAKDGEGCEDYTDDVSSVSSYSSSDSDSTESDSTESTSSYSDSSSVSSFSSFDGEENDGKDMNNDMRYEDTSEYIQDLKHHETILDGALRSLGGVGYGLNNYLYGSYDDESKSSVMIQDLDIKDRDILLYGKKGSGLKAGDYEMTPKTDSCEPRYLLKFCNFLNLDKTFIPTGRGTGKEIDFHGALENNLKNNAKKLFTEEEWKKLSLQDKRIQLVQKGLKKALEDSRDRLTYIKKELENKPTTDLEKKYGMWEQEMNKDFCNKHRFNKLLFNLKLRINEGMMINHSLARLRDDLKSIMLNSVAIKDTKTDNIYLPIMFDSNISPAIRNTYLEDEYFDRFLSNETKPREVKGKIMKIIQSDFECDINNMHIAIFTVINLTDTDNVTKKATNNPPNPPYINISELIYNLPLEYGGMSSETNQNQIMQIYNETLQKTMTYNFYATNTVLLKLINDIKKIKIGAGDFMETVFESNIKKFIELIQQNNPSTLIGSIESTDIIKNFTFDKIVPFYNEKINRATWKKYIKFGLEYSNQDSRQVKNVQEINTQLNSYELIKHLSK